MAYNTYSPYFPATYTPYGGYSYQPQFQQAAPMMQQPMMQNNQQTAQPVQQQNAPTSPSGIIWVSSINDARMYPIAPNNAVALWDQNAAAVYLKQADASGKPSMKIYDLVERTETPVETQNESGAKVPAYATKDELAAVVGAVRGFDGIIGSIKSDIDTMKGDIYGLAGKKKTSKKVKDDDEGDED